MESTSSDSSHYTCAACRVRFNDLEAQRAHHKSPWHAANMKRKVDGLAPFTEAEFSASEEANANIFVCEICEMVIWGEEPMQRHVMKKHLRGRLEMEDEEEENEGGEEEKDIDEVNRRACACVFCDLASDSPESNFDHMRKVHGFFLPDIEHLSDLPSLLAYLYDKVTEEHACLWCHSVFSIPAASSVKGVFRNATDVRRHMADKGHGKVLYEDGAERELQHFYDFSPSPKDDVVEEGDDSAESAFIEPTLDPITQDLILSNGQRLGHRTNNRYYRQYIRPAPSTTSSDVDVDAEALNNTTSALTAPSSNSVALSIASVPRSQQNNAQLVAYTPAQLVVIAKQEKMAQKASSKRLKKAWLANSMKNNLGARQRYNDPEYGWMV